MNKTCGHSSLGVGGGGSALSRWRAPKGLNNRFAPQHMTAERAIAPPKLVNLSTGTYTKSQNGSLCQWCQGSGSSHTFDRTDLRISRKLRMQDWDRGMPGIGFRPFLPLKVDGTGRKIYWTGQGGRVSTASLSKYTSIGVHIGVLQFRTGLSTDRS